MESKKKKTKNRPEIEDLSEFTLNNSDFDYNPIEFKPLYLEF